MICVPPPTSPTSNTHSRTHHPTQTAKSNQAGFNRVMGGSSISLLRPEELELLVCGTPHLNFHELEEVARYEGCVCSACVCGYVYM